MPTTTHTSHFHTQQNKVHGKRLKSILKGDPETEKEEDEDIDIKNNNEKEGKKKDDRFVSTINGNIVHVTVNNFITTDKQAQQQQQTPSKLYNNRPFSSDTKERKERAYQQQASKIHPSDSSLSSTLKNPYEAKLANKVGLHPRGKKKEESRNLMMIYDRPISAKVAEERRKNMKGLAYNPLAEKLGHDMGPNSSGKKRYPSSNHR